MKKCPYCGKQIDDDAAFCFFCMKSLRTKKEILPNSRKKGSRIAVCLIAVLLLCGILLGILLNPANDKKISTAASNILSGSNPLASEQSIAGTTTSQQESGSSSESSSTIDNSSTESGSSAESGSSSQTAAGTSSDSPSSGPIWNPIPQVSSGSSASSSEPSKPSSTIPTSSTPTTSSTSSTASTSSTKPTSSSSTSSGTTHPDYKYKEVDGGISITAYTGTQSSITVPSSIDGKTVVGIESLRPSSYSLTSVTLPNTLLYIEDYAFAGMDVAVWKLPASVRYIGAYAFSNSELVKSVYIYSTDLTFHEDAFSYGSVAMVPGYIEWLWQLTVYAYENVAKKLSPYSAEWDTGIVVMK